MFLRRRFCSSHPCRRSLARCAPDSPAAACGPDAVCAVATAVVEAVRDALPLRLHRAWRWVLLPPAAPTADRSAFRCAGPTLECAVAAGVLPAAESALPVFESLGSPIAVCDSPTPNRVPASRYAPVDREPPWGSCPILREVLKMFQSFFPPFQALLRYHARGFVCVQSSPFTNIANSSVRIVTLRTPSTSGPTLGQ